MKTFAQSWFHFCPKGDPVFWQLDFLLYTISLRYESRCINSFHQPCSLNLQSGSCTSIGLEIWKKLSESSDFWKFPLEGEIGLVTKMVIMWSIVMVRTILFWTKTNEIWIFYILFRPLLIAVSLISHIECTDKLNLLNFEVCLENLVVHALGPCICVK